MKSPRKQVAIYLPKSSVLGTANSQPDEALKQQLEGLSNQDIQKMILELESEEKQWMQKTKDIKVENQVLR